MTTPKEKKQLEQIALEQRYRYFVKIGCLVTLVILALIDAIFASFVMPREIALALIAIVAGIETREFARKKKEYNKVTRKK